MKIINYGLLILSICIGSIEAAREMPSEQDVVSELRRMSRELHPEERANVGELLQVLQLPAQTEVRIIGATSIIKKLNLPPKDALKLCRALTNEDIYREVVNDFFDNARARNIQFMAEESRVLGSDDMFTEDESIKTSLRNLFLHTEDIRLKRAFVTFIAIRLAEPTIGAQYFHPSELDVPFMFIRGSDDKASYRGLRFCEESHLRLKTIIQHDQSPASDDGTFAFNSDLHIALLHELGHFTDSLMSLQHTIDADKTLSIVHHFVQKRDPIFRYSSVDYARDSSNVVSFFALKILGAIDRSEPYLPKQRYTAIVANIKSHLTPQSRQQFDQDLAKWESAIQASMTGRNNFYPEIIPEVYTTSSGEFWQIIGLRLIEEAPNRRVLYVNKFSDFLSSLLRGTPIRLDHLTAMDEDDEVYLTPNIIAVYRALAKLHLEDFDRYLSRFRK